MGVKTFKIVFDRKSKKFLSGQTVKGKVVLTLDQVIKVRGISIQFKGAARTNWDVTSETTDNEGKTIHKTVEYVGNETYFENKFHIIGGPSSETTLQHGEHIYPFKSDLPPNLPTSFENSLGHVRYTVKVVLECISTAHHETEEKFDVFCPVDLNEKDSCKKPVKLTKEKHFCCCCCQSGPLTIVVCLPHSGFVPGQSIPVTVEVDNASDENITALTVCLQKCMKFTTTSPSKETKEDKTKLLETNCGSVAIDGSETWTKKLLVPNLPSELKNCSLIGISYTLQIKAKVSAVCSSDVEILVPVVIGTVPLTNTEPPALTDGPQTYQFEDDIDETSDSSFVNVEGYNGGNLVNPIGFTVPPGVPAPGAGMMPMYAPQFPNMYPNNPNAHPSMSQNMGMNPVPPGQNFMGMQPNIAQPNIYTQPPTNMPFQQGIPYPGIPGVHGYGSQPPGNTVAGVPNVQTETTRYAQSSVNPNFNSYQNASAPM